MNKFLFFLGLLLIGQFAYSQAYNPTGKALDESSLALGTGTTVVTDATADGGHSIYRSASAERATMWYGPYIHLQGGNYLVQFRLKVNDNTSTSTLCAIDVSSLTGGVSNAVLFLSPSMFRRANEWQLFTLTVSISDNVNNVEFRGLDFIPGVADLSLDYITIIPGDIKGIYSEGFSIDTKGNLNTTSINAGGAIAYTNSRNSFNSFNIGNRPGVNAGWISADFGGTDNSDRLVIGSGYNGKAIIATHNYNLTDWGGSLLINPQGGNVGIGTINPSEKLSVDGNIRTRKVIVTQTGWPDYVFDSSYQIPSLDSVSSFIQVNKRLPDMPSAAVVEKDGHDLGEVQKQLLKKVEELTLYVIEQQKKIAEIEKCNRRLQLENEMIMKSLNKK
ncbi:MAG: hypothetical protein J0I41_24310 [Filimonas sp.]|nr:hypothetical protein [Filimonas sp.]